LLELVIRATLAHQERKVFKVIKDIKEFKEVKDSRVCRDIKDFRAFKVIKDSKEFKVIRVLLVLLVDFISIHLTPRKQLILHPIHNHFIAIIQAAKDQLPKFGLTMMILQERMYIHL